MKSPVKRVPRGVVDGRMRHLRNLILKARDEQTLDALLSDILTPQELTSLAERVAILEALGRGDTLRAVAGKVHVSIGKVERGSNVVQHGRYDWKQTVT